jgi:hypothetical protein
MYPGSEYISASSGLGQNLSSPSNSQNGFEALPLYMKLI